MAKIIRNPIEGIEIDVNAILPGWIEALPIEIDIEEVEPSYGLLLELIARQVSLSWPNDHNFSDFLSKSVRLSDR